MLLLLTFAVVPSADMLLPYETLVLPERFCFCVFVLGCPTPLQRAGTSLCKVIVYMHTRPDFVVVVEGGWKSVPRCNHISSYDLPLPKSANQRFQGN